MGVCIDRRNLAIVTEYVAGRDLRAMIHDPAVEMTIRQKLNIAKGIAQGKFSVWLWRSVDLSVSTAFRIQG